MSDFDREAEREKLREQFERDKQKREQSERMSELLLKGATMTNKHCDTCGDPIFRHDGQEFCPTCHGPGQQQQQAQQQSPASQSTAQSTSSTDGIAGAEPQQPGDPTEAARDASEAPEPEPAPAPDPTQQPSGSRPPDEPRTATDPQPRQPDPQGTAPAAGDDLSTARASLTRSLSTLARKAEATDDLSRKREYLAAAKEAAEALDAAERVGR